MYLMIIKMKLTNNKVSNKINVKPRKFSVAAILKKRVGIYPLTGFRIHFLFDYFINMFLSRRKHRIWYRRHGVNNLNVHRRENYG